MNEQAEIRQLAATKILEGVNFLDKNGDVGARKSDVDKIELIFTDGTKKLLDPVQLHWLQDVSFRLRKSKD